MTPNLERARHDLDQAVLERDHLTVEHTRREQFDLANQWRVERIDQLDQQVAQHWTDAVIDAARDGHPTAYGTQRLQAARAHLAARAPSGERHSAARGQQRSAATRSRHPRPRPTASPIPRHSATTASGSDAPPPIRARRPPRPHTAHPVRTESRYLIAAADRPQSFQSWRPV